MAYNAGFELGKLRDACNTFDHYGEWFANIESRFVDLLAPFRSFSYYHPDQGGTASIKAVYPALTGNSYADLPIAEEGVASNEYLRVTFGDVEEEEQRKVRQQLEEYCATDTRAMMEIVEELGRVCE